ncbi:Putative peptidoglycan binding domain-containing protein [Lachnospiraceae bacterium XBB1006]|nr:Putative peptidoglycan binding domain-containing protein [Lachnospiraceae bacterium XBB1006]
MSSTNEETKQGGKRILLAIVALLVIAYVATSLYFKWHFYPNTTIGEMDVSGMSEKTTQKTLTEEIKTYKLTLQERGKQQEEISGEEITLRPDFGTTLKDALKSQSGFLWMKYLFSKQEIEKQAVTYDAAKLDASIKALACGRKDAQKAPKDAYLTYAQKKYVIVPEELGSSLDWPVFTEKITKAVDNMDESVDLEKENCYVNPTITSEDKVLNKSLAEANAYLKTSVTYDDGVKQLLFDENTIKEMLLFKKDGTVKLSSKALQGFVAKVNQTYSTVWGHRSFLTSYGKTVTVSGGDYGWKVDTDKELKELKKAIKNHTVETREPYFSKSAASHTDKDYGNTYVEINLTAQHLFVYDKGSKVFETDFVSGNVSKGNGTRLGMNSLKYKERNAVLRGDDYETPVGYWMPFDGNIGMHDATWRAKFGGIIYKTAGSHGCVNLPLSSAARIFDLVSPGEAIIVYELPGTETVKEEPKDKDKEKDKNKDKEKEEKKEKQNREHH